MSSKILINSHQHVMEIRFNRPEKKNSITTDMYQALLQGFRDAAADPDIRAVVLRGSDDCFCAGNDIADLASAAADPKSATGSAGDFMKTVTEFPKPLLAAVSGPAIGIGLTLLPQCDFVYAAPDAYFTTPFTALGVCPEAGASFSLAACIGWRRAAEMLLLSERYDAQKALSAGLIQAIYPTQELYAKTMEVAEQLAAFSAISVQTTKRLMRHEFSRQTNTAFDREIEAFSTLLASPEAQQSFAAFLDPHKKN